MNNPDDSERDFTTFDALFQPLETPLRQHEQDHPPHHREVLHFAHFVRLLVYHFVKSCESGGAGGQSLSISMFRGIICRSVIYRNVLWPTL
jgi:hypothetical protein